jgi:hypothetical protein
MRVRSYPRPSRRYKSFDRHLPAGPRPPARSRAGGADQTPLILAGRGAMTTQISPCGSRRRSPACLARAASATVRLVHERPGFVARRSPVATASARKPGRRGGAPTELPDRIGAPIGLIRWSPIGTGTRFDRQRSSRLVRALQTTIMPFQWSSLTTPSASQRQDLR